MIYNFVLPEVEKHNMRNKIRNQQQNYMQNAFISIYEKILDLPSEPSQVTVEPSQVQKIYEKSDNVQTIYVTENTVKIDDSPISHHFLCKNIY